MFKSQSQAAHYAVYLAVRLLVCVLQTLPLQTACAFAGALAWLLYHIDRRHRDAALDNLRHAFGEQLTDAQREHRVRAVYRHFCTMLIEMIHMPRKLHVNNWRDHLELVGGRRLVDGLLSDRPLLFITGHYGNWEMGGYVLGLLGFQTYAVARTLDNPYLDDFLRRFRERTGQQILAKKGDFDQMQAILEAGGKIATLGDQDAGARGLFVDFFGRPASTHKAIALMALEYNVPLVVTVTRRAGGPLHYQTVGDDAILPEEYAGRPDALRAITQRFTAALERLIRAAPEQYLWLHRRWKHQPPQKKAKQAA